MAKQPGRFQYERRSITTFEKTYGDDVYAFTHDVHEIEGWVSAFVTVRKKVKGTHSPHVGEVVHSFHWDGEPEERPQTVPVLKATIRRLSRWVTVLHDGINQTTKEALVIRKENRRLKNQIKAAPDVAANWLESVGEKNAAYLLRTVDIPAPEEE
jgi:hypothetical protein